MPLLEVQDVSRRYGGVHAVQNVSFQLEVGEWLGVIGPNGAGKSTLFNTLGGQVAPSSGRVVLDGQDITKMSPHRRFHAGISRSFQISSLFPNLSVREHLTIACRQQHRWSGMRRWNSDRALNARVATLLEQWDLGRSGGTELPGEMSYGAQRRLELALATSSNPKLLLLDEPNVGLTRQECDDLRERVETLGKQTAVIFVAHDMDMVMGWSHRILVMHQGELVADGTPEAIIKDKFVEEVYLGVEHDSA